MTSRFIARVANGLSASNFLCATGMMSAALLWVAPATAVQLDSSTSDVGASVQLEDILVTARKRDETLLSVPVAVSVVSQADIARYDAADLTSLGQLVPNLIISASSANAGASFTLRGIGSSPGDTGLDSSVNVLLDGAPISRGRIITASMFDLERVEVLEGPQALFFGKNSSAGVIALTSAGPTDTLQGAVKTGYELTTNERFVEAFAAGPITDAFKFRLAVRASESDGFLRNYAIAQPTPAAFGGPNFPLPGASDKSFGSTDDLSGRITLVYDAGGHFDATFKVTAGRFLGNADDPGAAPVCRPGFTSNAYGIVDPTGHCSATPTLNVSIGDMNPQEAATIPDSNGGVPYTNTKLVVTSTTLNYHWNDLTFSSVTGYSDLDYIGTSNFDQTTWAQVVSVEGERNHDASEELRVASDWKAPVNFSAGAYYEYFHRADPTYVIFGNFGPDPATGKYDDYEKTPLNSGHTVSPFAQVRWSILDNLELDAGARYTHETKSALLGNAYVNAIVGPLLGFKPAGEFISGSLKSSNTSPEVTLTWHPDKEQTVYAAYKQGYKSGGFAAPGILSTAFTGVSTITFKPEVAKGEEIGYKALLFDRTLRIDVTAYKYTYSDLQVVGFDAATLTYQVKNSGGASTKGIEANAQWRVLAPLTLRASAAYDKARYSSFNNAQCYGTQTELTGCTNGTQDLSGMPTTRAPKWVGSFGGTYEVPIGAALRIGLDGDAHYSSGFYTEGTDDPFLYTHSFWLINAGIRLHPASDKWDVGIFGKNLTDHLYGEDGYQTPAATPTGGTYFLVLQNPRTIQMQGTYHF